MAFYTSLVEQVRRLSPSRLKQLTNERLSVLVESEAARARARVDELAARFPSATQKELCERLIDGKKQLAGVVGGVTGVFGAVTVPVDLVGMVYLQLSLLVEIATVYKVNLKAERARQELLDLFGYANGIGPVQRSSPKVVGSLAAMLLARGGAQDAGPGDAAGGGAHLGVPQQPARAEDRRRGGAALRRLGARAPEDAEGQRAVGGGQQAAGSRPGGLPAPGSRRSAEPRAPDRRASGRGPGMGGRTALSR